LHKAGLLYIYTKWLVKKSSLVKLRVFTLTHPHNHNNDKRNNGYNDKNTKAHACFKDARYSFTSAQSGTNKQQNE
jgi:hypothetical protein